MEPWRDAAGALVGWKRPPRPGGPAANRLLVFHGNAGYALHRTPYVDGFTRLDGGQVWEVFLFEYPGYGARAGSPSEASFLAAGLAALDTLFQEDRRPVFLLGESVGSGPACAAASRAPGRVRGLFLVTPFASLAEVAARHYPYLPIGLILRDRWENGTALRGFHGPLGVRVAGLDEIVTMAQGRKLYDEYPGPKRLWIDDEAGHNTLNLDAAGPWWKEASDFMLGTARGN